ncbi:MAG: DUF362 domain-containing protein [Clostridia bacterium]|nr:DUF362 domain-containing protein [Clostridia bacterium]
MEKKLIVTYGEDVQKMTKEVLEKAELEKMIPKGARIGIKPNLVVAKPASSGATTSPAIISALIEYLQEYGNSDILILESSWIGDHTRRAFKVCGYEEISRKYGIPLFDIKSDTYSVKSYGGISMEISNKVLAMDFLINVPVLKGHCQTMITGALKNLKGCISDREKRRFHTMGLHRPIAYLNKILTSNFILVDSLCGDLDFEEGGNPVKMNRIFCGTDPVLIDAYIAATMGYSPEDIGHIKIAADIGVGDLDIDKAEIVVINKDTTKVHPVFPTKVKRLARYTEAKEACSACYANLIHALARLDEKGLLQRFKNTPIKIGQGYKNLRCDGPGVGNCVSGAEHVVKGCPPSTKAIRAFLEEYVKGRQGK